MTTQPPSDETKAREFILEYFSGAIRSEDGLALLTSLFAAERERSEMILKLAAKPTWDDVNAEIKRTNIFIAERDSFREKAEALEKLPSDLRSWSSCDCDKCNQNRYVANHIEHFLSAIQRAKGKEQ